MYTKKKLTLIVAVREDSVIEFIVTNDKERAERFASISDDKKFTTEIDFFDFKDGNKAES